jgi:hypothetical protein
METKSIYKIIELLISNGITLFVQDDCLKVKKRTNNKMSIEVLEIIKSKKWFDRKG